MKRILRLLLLAGALTLLPSLSAIATPRQSSAPAAQPQATANPQAKEPRATSPHKPRRSSHKKTTHTQRHHKASAKH